MSDLLQASRGQIKVRVSNAENKNDMIEVEIVFCAHFWCMQVWAALNQHAYLREPQGLGLSPGGVNYKQRSYKTLLPLDIN